MSSRCRHDVGGWCIGDISDDIGRHRLGDIVRCRDDVVTMSCATWGTFVGFLSATIWNLEPKGYTLSSIDSLDYTKTNKQTTRMLL